MNAHFQDAFTSPYLDPNQQNQQSSLPTGPALDFGDASFFHHENNQAHVHAYSQDYSQLQHPQHSFPPQGQPTLAPSAPIGKEYQYIGKEYQDASSSQTIYPTPPDLHQMSTPPPTRGSSIKRRPQRTDPVVFGTPSSIRRTQQLDQPGQPINFQMPAREASPVKVSQLNMSQPQFHFQQPQSTSHVSPSQPNMVFAQPRPISNNANTAQAWATLDDPFSVASSAWAQTNAEGSLTRSYSAASGLRRADGHKSRPSQIDTSRNPNYGGHLYGPRQSPEKRRLTHASVDPSLVYSSPTRPATSDSTQTNTMSRSSSSASLARVPYQHSLNDPRQELENARPTRLRPQPTQTGVRPQSQGNTTRPELQRSNTVTNMRSYSQTGQDVMHSGTLARSNSTASLPRRSSPLKRDRINRASLSSISETPKPALRTSVILTVDSNGRARTETRVVESSPTKSARDKYPSLWDESDSDSETPVLSRSTSQWPSRNSSLGHSRGDERHSKVAKLDPPLEDLENLHLPRSNSSASLASLKTPSKAAYSAAAQLRRQGSAKKPRPSMQSRRNTLSSLNSSFESLVSVDSLSSDVSQPQTDAGSALRQMMASRGPGGSEPQVIPDPVPTSARKPQGATFEPRKFHQKSQSLAAAPPPNFGYGHAHFPIDCAPMQPPIPSPTHSTHYMQGPMFRCICNLPLDDGRGAVACGFCNMFLHAACLGMDPQRLPAQYICNFCTNSANMMPPPNPAQTYAGWGVAGI